MTTKKIPLTYDKALATLQELVAEKGADYICPSDTEVGYCYVERNRPSCIVGHVLHRIGVPLRILKRYEGTSAFVLVEELLDTESKTKNLLQAVQTSQDCKAPWGQALSHGIWDTERRLIRGSR